MYNNLTKRPSGLLVPTIESSNSFTTPNFVFSNEAWTPESRAAIREASGEVAVFVGSGNATTVAPQIEGLETIVFADIQAGHKDMFDLRVRAARETLKDAVVKREPMTEDEMEDYIAGIAMQYAGKLVDEMSFLESVEDRFVTEASLFIYNFLIGESGHVSMSIDSMKELVSLVDSDRVRVEAIDIDVTEPYGLKSVENIGSVAWLHCSNVLVGGLTLDLIEGRVSSYEEAIRQAKRLLEFVCGYPGVDENTIVAYANYILNTGDMLVVPYGVPVPLVSTAGIVDLSPEDLLTKYDYSVLLESATEYALRMSL